MAINDLTRAAVISFVSSIFPVLQLAGILDLTGDQVAVVMVLVGNTLTLAALVFKQGQQASGTSGTVTVTATPTKGS